MVVFLAALPLLSGAIGCLCSLGRGASVGFWDNRVATESQSCWEKSAIAAVYILIATSPALNVSVDRVVLVHNVDGFALDRELDMDGASTIVGWCQIFATVIIVLCISFLFLLVGFAVLILQAVLADIIQARTITAGLGIEGVTLGVLESICLFDGCNYRPACF